MAWQQRVSRRCAMRSAAVAGGGLAAASLIGCRQESQPASQTTSTAPQPKRGGTFTRGGNLALGGRLFRGLDPHVVTGAFGGTLRLSYQSLLRLNPKSFEVEPELAQKWEFASPTEFIVHLAPNVRWHNKAPVSGRELTANDVVFSLNRVATNEPRFTNRSLLDSVERVEAVDKSTVRLRFKQPDVSTIVNIAGFNVAVLAPEAVERFDTKFTTAETVIGTGAFIVNSVTDVGGSAVRNPDYWKPGLPYLDEVRMQDTSDTQAWWSAFLARQMDVSYVPGADAEKVFAEQQGKPYNVEWFRDMTVHAIQANTVNKPFDDRRVTRALRLLIDHEEAVKVIGTFNGRGYMSTAFPSTLSEWDLPEEEYLSRYLEFKRPKDEAVREALSLLSAAGYTKENPLKFNLETASSNTTGALTGAQALLAQYQKFAQGTVQAEIKLSESAALQTSLTNRAFEYVITDLVAPMPFEPDSWLRTFYHSTGSRNYGKYSDPALDRMIDQQRTMFDVAQRKSAVKEALRYLIQNAPYTAWAGDYTLNAWQTKVKDWAPEANSAIWGFQYEHVWLDT